MKLNKSLFLFIVLLLGMIFTASTSFAKQCIATFDFGQGSVFYMDAKNPILVFPNPANAQTASWTATGLSTFGVPNNGDNSQMSEIKMYVTGEWSPWPVKDLSSTKACNKDTCNATNSVGDICNPDGIVVLPGINDADIPCKLSKGLGLYGLISLDFNGVRMNPNDPAYAKNLTDTYFRTFRINALEHDADGDFFTLKNTSFCDVDGVCTQDVAPNGTPYIPRGQLYLKFYDRYYGDNVGQYQINIVTGLYKGKGIIETTIETVTDVLHRVTEFLYISVVNNTKFIAITRAVMVLYVAITGALFMIGGIRITQGELITRLFKIGIVATLISPESWDFFNTYLFSFFTDGAKSISDIIIQSTLSYNDASGLAKVSLPPDANILTAFDAFLSIIVSQNLHMKILSLALKNYYFVYVIFIYIALYILLAGIFRAVMLYVTALIVVALLLVIAPIFIIMILFRITKDLFEGWLKQLLSNAIMLIVVSITAVLMANLVLDQLFELLYFQVCYDYIVGPYKIGDTEIFSISFWKPTDWSQVDKCITAPKLFAWILVCFLFDNYIKYIPEFIDTLAGAFFMPMSSFFEGAMSRFEQGPGAFVEDKINLARSALPGGGWVAAGVGFARIRSTGNQGALDYKKAHNLSTAVRGLEQLPQGIEQGFSQYFGHTDMVAGITTEKADKFKDSAFGAAQRKVVKGQAIVADVLDKATLGVGRKFFD